MAWHPPRHLRDRILAFQRVHSLDTMHVNIDEARNQIPAGQIEMFVDRIGGSRSGADVDDATALDDDSAR